MFHVDLNADLGEGGAHDAALMPLLSSANIACGGHAGDEATMRATIGLALRDGVGIGAHPGFPDRENFGRVELGVGPAQAAEMVFLQIQKLQDIARGLGAVVQHVKLHGALYTIASRDPAMAEAIVKAIWVTEKSPVVYALAGSALAQVVQAHPDFILVNEGFADRTYQRDGSLTPRSQPDALITDEKAAVAQVLRMVREGRVRATDGTDLPVKADTLCLHGDGEHALALLRAVRAGLSAAGVAVRRPEA